MDTLESLKKQVAVLTMQLDIIKKMLYNDALAQYEHESQKAKDHSLPNAGPPSAYTTANEAQFKRALFKKRLAMLEVFYDDSI